MEMRRKLGHVTGLALAAAVIPKSCDSPQSSKVEAPSLADSSLPNSPPYTGLQKRLVDTRRAVDDSLNEDPVEPTLTIQLLKDLRALWPYGHRTLVMRLPGAKDSQDLNIFLPRHGYTKKGFEKQLADAIKGCNLDALSVARTFSEETLASKNSINLSDDDTPDGRRRNDERIRDFIINELGVPEDHLTIMEDASGIQEARNRAGDGGSYLDDNLNWLIMGFAGVYDDIVELEPNEQSELFLSLCNALRSTPADLVNEIAALITYQEQKKNHENWDVEINKAAQLIVLLQGE